MRAYGEVLRVPGLARIILAQLIARFPAGMYSLGILMHIEHEHGSYTAAGLVLAAFSVGMAIAGPFVTRLMARFGTVAQATSPSARQARPAARMRDPTAGRCSRFAPTRGHRHGHVLATLPACTGPPSTG